jgi:hypothetical protein
MVFGGVNEVSKKAPDCTNSPFWSFAAKKWQGLRPAIPIPATLSNI